MRAQDVEASRRQPPLRRGLLRVTCILSLAVAGLRPSKAWPGTLRTFRESSRSPLTGHRMDNVISSAHASIARPIAATR
eukprot:9199980-Pyramimonas_sp.AAC.1